MFYCQVTSTFNVLLSGDESLSVLLSGGVHSMFYSQVTSIFNVLLSGD